MNGLRIIVIGGGIIGLAVARRLLEMNAHVTVIAADDARPPATLAAAGMLAPSFERSAGPLGQPLLEFGRASLARWPAFAAALEGADGRCVDFRGGGMFGVALDEPGAAALAARYRETRAAGGNVEWLDGVDVIAAEPALSPAVVAGIFAPDDAQVDPRRVLDLLRADCRRAGADFVDAAAARILMSGGRVAGALLDNGARIEADVIVVATGAFDAAAGAAPPPVRPVKGEALAVAAPGLFNTVVRGPGAYLCPKADGRLVIGATELEGDVSLAPDNRAVEALRSSAEALAPGLAGASEVARWAGLRPGTPDGAPILGPAPDGPEGLVYALGHYRNGILLAPETAMVIADFILEGRTARALSEFSPARFGPAATV